MFAIIGLGNHENAYHKHRHNVGFMFVDYLVMSLREMNEVNDEAISLQYKHDKYANSQLAKVVINNHELLLAKPQTFMNLSGQAVQKIVGNWKLEIGNLIIIHDDLDIPLGKFKIDRGVGPKLHNGIRSIEEQLETKDFWRVRIGVDNRNPEHHISGETYVLENFKPDERKIIDDLFPHIWQRIQKELLNML